MDDLISRQAVLDQTYLWSKDELIRVTNPFDYLRKRIYSLPSITPAGNVVGRWITLKDEYGDIVEAVCSCCSQNGNHEWAYCPNCGTRMTEPQEGGDKE